MAQPALQLDMSQNPLYSPSGQRLPKACSDIPQVCTDVCIHVQPMLCNLKTASESCIVTNASPKNPYCFQQMILLRAKMGKQVIQVKSDLQDAIKDGMMMIHTCVRMKSFVCVLKFQKETTLPFLSVYRRRPRYALLLLDSCVT